MSSKELQECRVRCVKEYLSKGDLSGYLQCLGKCVGNGKGEGKGGGEAASSASAP